MPSWEEWEVKESVLPMAMVPLSSTALCTWRTLNMHLMIDWLNEWKKINEWKWTPKSCLAGGWTELPSNSLQPPPLSTPQKTVKLSGPVVIQGTIFLNVAFSKVNILLKKKKNEASRLRSFFKSLQWLKSSYSKYPESCILLKEKKKCHF